MTTLQRHSPCKVNFLLNILGKRPDGFHQLETLFHPVALTDQLTFTKSGSGLRLTCNIPQLPTDTGNLVHRAAQLFLDKTGINDGVAIHLEKRVPLAAGLGGGSANAAHTLLALNELFEYPLSDLQPLAATLGSDVPFFLQNNPALGLGRGEQIQSLEPFPSLKEAHIFLHHPGFGISTAWAYQNLARFSDALNGRPGRALQLAEVLRHSTLQEAAPHFYNSLEAPALEKFPILSLFQEHLRENGAAVALMSGSGSTTFALASSKSAAERLAEKFRSHFGDGGWTAIAPLN